MIELFRNNSAKSGLQSYKIFDSNGDIIKLKKCSYSKNGIQLIQNEKHGWEWYQNSYDFANEIMIEHRTSGTSYEQIKISWAKNFKKRRYFADLFENEGIILKAIEHYCNVWTDSKECPFHGDFSIDNILFKGDRVLIIDWEHFNDKHKAPWGFDLIHLFFESMWLSMKYSRRTRARLRDIIRISELFEEITTKNPNFSFWKKSPLQKLTSFMWENQNLWGEIIQKHPEKFPVLNFSKWQIENIDSFF